MLPGAELTELQRMGREHAWMEFLFTVVYKNCCNCDLIIHLKKKNLTHARRH